TPSGPVSSKPPSSERPNLGDGAPFVMAFVEFARLCLFRAHWHFSRPSGKNLRPCDAGLTRATTAALQYRSTGQQHPGPQVSPTQEPHAQATFRNRPFVGSATRHLCGWGVAEQSGSSQATLQPLSNAADSTSASKTGRCRRLKRARASAIRTSLTRTSPRGKTRRKSPQLPPQPPSDQRTVGATQR